MKFRAFVLGVLITALPAIIASASGPRHVGLVWNSPPQEEIDRGDRRHLAAVLIPEHLRELGWVVGSNLRISSISAEGRYERFPAIIDEMVRRKVDVLVVFGPESSRIARERAGAIPIVWTEAYNHPAGRQAGNVTGTAIPNPMIKRIELLRAVAPATRRVAMLARVAPGSMPPVIRPQSLKDIRSFGFEPFTLYFTEPEELEGLFEKARREGADAMYMSAFPRLTWDEELQRHVARLAARHRLPTVYELPEIAKAGGLVGFGIDARETHRRTAYYIDRILRGAKVADLPMEQPTRYLMTVNRRAARELGLALPASLLLQADEVLE